MEWTVTSLAAAGEEVARESEKIMDSRTKENFGDAVPLQKVDCADNGTRLQHGQSEFRAIHWNLRKVFSPMIRPSHGSGPPGALVLSRESLQREYQAAWYR